MRRASFLFLASALLAACSSDKSDPETRDGGTAVDAAPARDAGFDDGGSRDAGPDRDAGSRDGGEASLTVEAFCPAYYDAMCAWNGSCRSPGATDCNFPYAADLLESCEGFAKREADGVMHFDPVAAAACLDQDFAACGSPRPFESEACLSAFVGDVAVGGDCYILNNRPFDRECVSTAFCNSVTCPGECVAYGTLGADCSAGPPCDSATWCDGGRCVPRATEGETCADIPCLAPYGCYSGVCRLGRGIGEACAPDAPCTFTLFCADGSCTNRVGSGEACGRAEHCPSGELCIGNNTIGRTCRTPLGANEVCDPMLDGGICGVEGVCLDVSNGGPADYRCLVPGRDGDPCGDRGCANGFWCRYGGAGDDPDGTCRPWGGPQDSCASAAAYGGERRCIQDYFCIEEVCSPPSGDGGPCNYFGTCTEGLWCSGTQCRGPAGDGEMCSRAWSMSCDAATFCDENDLCTPKRANGALCDSNETCLSDYCGLDMTGTNRCEENPGPCVRP